MIIKPYPGRFEFSEIAEDTRHLSKRDYRLEVSKKLGDAKILKCFLVDKQHRDGEEIHVVCDNGCIYIVNYNTKKFITVLIARPGQLRRYYTAVGLLCPRWLQLKAKKNLEAGLNY